MLKALLVIVALFFQLVLFSQKIDTITTFDWDTTTHQFKNSQQQIFNYNGACYLTKYVIDFWDSASAKYTKYYRNTNSLLANNATSQSLIQLWDDAAKKWDNYQKGIYNYTTNPKLPSTVLYQDWQSSNSSWVNSRLYTYTYDANGNTTNILTQELKVSGSSWSNLYQNQYTYTASNKLLSFLQLIWNSSTWKNFNLINYTYNSFDNALSDSGQKWDAPTSSWINTYKSDYTYDVSNYLKVWNYNVWDNATSLFAPSQQYLYTNNAIGNALETLTLNFNGTTWDTLFNEVNHYNSCILPVDLLSFEANNKNGKTNVSWQVGNEINVSHYNIQRSSKSSGDNGFTIIGTVNAKNISSYLYQDDLTKPTIFSPQYFYRIEIVDRDGQRKYSPVRQINLLKNQSQVQVFPNPATTFINVLQKGNEKIICRDITGRILLNKVISGIDELVKIPVNNFPKGLMIVELINGKKESHFEKIIVQ